MPGPDDGSDLVLVSSGLRLEFEAPTGKRSKHADGCPGLGVVVRAMPQSSSHDGHLPPVFPRTGSEGILVLRLQVRESAVGATVRASTAERLAARSTERAARLPIRAWFARVQAVQAPLWPTARHQVGPSSCHLDELFGPGGRARPPTRPAHEGTG